MGSPPLFPFFFFYSSFGPKVTDQIQIPGAQVEQHPKTGWWWLWWWCWSFPGHSSAC